MQRYEKQSLGSRISTMLIVMFLIGMAVFCIYPVLYTIFASFSDPIALSKHTGIIWAPLGFTVRGYEIAFSYGSIISGYTNTILIAAFGTMLNMLLTTLGAYGLSRREMKLRKPLMVFIMITMFFSGGLIPFFLVVKSYGLIDNRLALILPVAINTMNLIILRTSISGVPSSLEESAMLDGANDFVILFRIIVPLVKSTLAVLTLYYIVGHWNSWFNAMLFIKAREKYPLQLILREILIANTSNAATSIGLDLSEMDQYKRLVKFCTIVIATVPILCIYPFLQKYFVHGVLIGSIKG
jgi:putative aldouronate transport system permease protein